MFRQIFVLFFLLLNTFNINAQGKKELVELSLSVTDSKGNPAEGVFSLSVTDADAVKADTMQPSLETYMLLTSEIKGHIENPNYYFKDNNARTAHHLDLLMMAQGWRRYELDNILEGKYPEINYSIETEQSISGTVNGTMGNSIKNVSLHLVTPKTGIREVLPLNGKKQFNITGLDFIDGTTFLLQAIKKNGGHRLINLEIDSLAFPALSVPAHQDRARLQPPPETFVAQANTQINNAGINGVTELMEIVKTGKKRMKPKNPYNLEPYKMITDDDPYLNSSGDIYNIFVRLGVRYEVVQEEGGDSPAYERKKPRAVIFIDNMKVEKIDVDQILDNLDPATIKSVELFHPRDPQLLVYGYVAWANGGVFIYTKNPDYGLPISMKTVRQKGYKPAVEFYSPQYPAKDKSKYSTPDHRTTLYWNPTFKTDSNGKGTVRFYSSDVSKKYLITVEGLTEDGRAVSKKELKEL